jgi:hypothetical protein
MQSYENFSYSASFDTKREALLRESHASIRSEVNKEEKLNENEEDIFHISE